eukprot:CAMPEP_0169086274 /NCGR_PEP_ID=MMETSP1015-20121227/13612_1 /TAXON_ID=342587 /ORGANISM="Karlodinium micrum, Strain CCMP2283" /LENGTH=82 /DNA_ID=CAMNT_0009146429 /DNA_START=250 /DNA_END=498 /DNA_ORIENTATION=+
MPAGRGGSTVQLSALPALKTGMICSFEGGTDFAPMRLRGVCGFRPAVKAAGHGARTCKGGKTSSCPVFSGPGTFAFTAGTTL